MTTFDVPGYEKLADVLERAYDQASRGKGKERHAAKDEPFHEQVICIGARKFGVGAAGFQAFKKAEELQRLPYEAAVKEALGAIVYMSAVVIELDRQEAERKAAEARPRTPFPGEDAFGWVPVAGCHPLPSPDTIVQLQHADDEISPPMKISSALEIIAGKKNTPARVTHFRVMKNGHS